MLDMTARSNGSPGKVFRWPRAYDLLLRLVWGRDEDRYRAHVLELAQIGPGQSVLDVGCGTGTLAIAAKRRVGPGGRVTGVDASGDMLARARRKAARQGPDIAFVQGTAQDLPFAPASFDVLLCTTVLHCLPAAQRGECLAEMARVLKPEGRLLLVDFGGSAASKRGVFGHMHAHRRFDLAGEISGLSDVGLSEIARGPTGFTDLVYVLAVAHRRQ
ncbi:MAG: methyltransferase domain-containing protein [Sphingomonas sp.]|nr:methyltransferase domain-containing protein [Sphingomonas sp.]